MGLDSRFTPGIGGFGLELRERRRGGVPGGV